MSPSTLPVSPDYPSILSLLGWGYFSFERGPESILDNRIEARERVYTRDPIRGTRRSSLRSPTEGWSWTKTIYCCHMPVATVSLSPFEDYHNRIISSNNLLNNDCICPHGVLDHLKPTAGQYVRQTNLVSRQCRRD